MRQFFKNVIVAVALIGGVSAVPLLVSPQTATAASPASQAEDGLQATGGGSANDDGLKDAVRTVVNILLFVIGAVAVVMLIIGGFKYVISNGNSGQMESAKNTILYAVIGIVIALAAYAIVGFVIDAF